MRELLNSVIEEEVEFASSSAAPFGLPNVSKIKLKLPFHNKWRLNKFLGKTLLPSFLFTDQTNGHHHRHQQHLYSTSVNSVEAFPPFVPVRERDAVSGLTVPGQLYDPLRHSHSAQSSVSRTSSSRTRQGSVSTVPSVLDSDAHSISHFEPVIPVDMPLHPLARFSSWHSYSSSSRFSKFDRVLGEAESGVVLIGESAEEAYGQKIDPLYSLPNEIIDHILSTLDVKSLGECAAVCQYWKVCAESNSLWRQLFLSQRYWETADDIPESVSWKELYKTRHILEKRWRAGTVNPMALQGHLDSVYCVDFDRDKIVTGSRDWTLKVWNASTGKLLKTLGRPRDEQANTSSITTTTPQDLFHTGSVLCITMDERVLISGSSDSSCIIWELPKFRPIKRVFRHTLGVLDIDMNDKYVVSCSKDSTISVWHRDAKYSLKCRLGGHRGPVNALQINGDYVVSAGGDKLVKLWSLTDETCIRSFQGHSRGLACVQISQCRKYVVSGGNDNTICIWDTESGHCLHRLEGHKNLVRTICIASGRIISGSYDRTIKVWDLETGQLITDLAGLHGSWIFSARADCQRIISTSFGTKPVILDFAAGLDKEILKFIIG